MHPRFAEGFEWDEWNTQKLAARHITEREVEQVFWNGAVWPKNKQEGSGDRFMIGFTDAGRALTLVVVVKQDARELRVITGWDSTTGERTRYLSKRLSREEK